MFDQFAGDPPRWQEVQNSLPARDRPLRERIPVLARIVWEKDGEEWRPGDARRLDPGKAIYVELSNESRCKFSGVWLSPNDVWWRGKG